MRLRKMQEKDWIRTMGQKFLAWREVNNYSGVISVPEIARWTLAVMQEQEEIYKEKKE